MGIYNIFKLSFLSFLMFDDHFIISLFFFGRIEPTHDPARVLVPGEFDAFGQNCNMG
jgi:hypothetical protein